MTVREDFNECEWVFHAGVVGFINYYFSVTFKVGMNRKYETMKYSNESERAIKSREGDEVH